jgi:succinyl-CoA synthetase alpha subunit
MLEAGTKLVAVVTPGKAGATVHDLPVFDTVAEAVAAQQANASILFVPAPNVRSAALEAIQAGIRLLVVVAEHVPVHDALLIREKAKQAEVVLIGPNTPGIISPDFGKLGIMPASLFSPGRIGMISRSGTLSYEVAGILQKAGYGVSTMVGIGGDPVVGTDMTDLLPMFAADPATDALVVVGEIGGGQENRLAEALGTLSIPVCAYIAGTTAPSGKRMGHAGAMMTEESASVERKTQVLKEAGALVARYPGELPSLLARLLPGRKDVSRGRDLSQKRGCG